MSKSNFIETKKAVDDITTAIDVQIASVTRLSSEVIKLNTNYAKLPSDYARNQQAIADANTKIAQTEVTLQNAVKQKQKLTSEEIVNQRVLRTNADRHATANSTLAGAYRNLSAQVSIASQRYQDLIVRGRTAEQTQRQYNAELRKAQIEFRNLQNRVLSADKAVDKWNRTGERSIGFVNNLMGAFGIVGGVTLFATITRDIFQTTKEIQSLNKALELVTGSQSNFAEQQLFLQRISESYGVELNGLTKQFTQFYVSAKDKLAAAEIQQIFESITKAGASMGLSVESQQRAFLALNQMMSKGTIQAEELRGQLGEALPGAFGIMAKAMGVTEKQLGKMMKDGDVIASEVLPKFAKQLEITYGIENVNRIENITSAQNRLTNAWTNFVASLDKDGNKLSKFFILILNQATETLKAWDRIFESAGTTRKKELDGIKQSNEELAKRNLASISDADQKQKYATERIIELNKKRAELIIDAKKIEEANNKILNSSDPNVKDKNSGELRRYWEKEVNKNKLALAGFNNEIKATDGLIAGYSSVLGKNKEVVKESTKEVTSQVDEQKKLNDAIEKELQLRNKLYLARANRELIGIKNELENDKLYFNQRLDLLDKQAQKETEIALLKYQENIRLHKDSNTQMEIDAIEFKNTIDQINKDRVDAGLKELERYYKEFDSYAEKFDGDGLKLDLFGDNPAEGFEKWKEGADKATDATEKLKEATKDWLKSFEDDFIGDSGFTTLFDILNGKIDGFGENFINTFIGVTEVFQEAMQFLSQNMNQSFENDKQALQEQYNFALQGAGDNAEARAEIERQYQAKQKEIRIREFKAKQQMAIINIGIDTAQAILATYARLGFPAGILPSAIIAGIGLAQAGFVSSQQVPQFYKGTDNAPEGFALTQEKGAEIITDKNGKIKSLGNNKGAQMTYLSKGDKVFTAEQSTQLMHNQALNSILTNSGIMPTQVVQNNNNVDLTPVVNAINNKPSVNLSIDKNGLEAYIKKGAANIQLQNKIITFSGLVNGK